MTKDIQTIIASKELGQFAGNASMTSVGCHNKVARDHAMMLVESLGVGVLGGMAAGPLGALAGAGGKLVYDLCNKGEEPKGHEVASKKAPKIGYPFIS